MTTLLSCIVVIPLFDTVDRVSKQIELRRFKQFLDNHPYAPRGEKLTGRAQKGIPIQENPGERFKQEYLLMIDPGTASVPRGRLIAANREATSRRLMSKGASASWDEREPDNVGGRTRAIMFDPIDSTNKRVFAGGVGR